MNFNPSSHIIFNSKQYTPSNDTEYHLLYDKNEFKFTVNDDIYGHDEYVDYYLEQAEEKLKGVVANDIFNWIIESESIDDTHEEFNIVVYKQVPKNYIFINPIDYNKSIISLWNSESYKTEIKHKYGFL